MLCRKIIEKAKNISKILHYQDIIVLRQDSGLDYGMDRKVDIFKVYIYQLF